MRIVPNTGADRVVDIVRPWLGTGNRVDLASRTLSLFAFGELAGQLAKMAGARLVLPPEAAELDLLGTDADRAARNRLQTRWLAGQCADWVEKSAEVRKANGAVPQGAIVLRNGDGRTRQALIGSFSFSTDGLGLAPGNPLNLIQASETPEECKRLGVWFDSQWSGLAGDDTAKLLTIDTLRRLAEHRAPSSIYALILHHLFRIEGGELDEDRVVKSATGIRETEVWQRLYRFQRDGVVGAIDKLDRFGGCIIADSVGLGKTFEALAIIKYHELRNDRVLVLCPKRLRDNWTLYRANDRRNILARDRFNYDVLNHTDLSRDRGLSGDIDLAHLNWGNYDLVVIDESHNFRNKRSPRQGSETRYDRLMRRIVREGVKTRVLMLTATPVNNRLADLRNQIAFATEYAPLRYVLAHRQEAYDKKYSTRLRRGGGTFRQLDREESLVHLLRANVPKRMESSVASFALTVQRQLNDIEVLLARIEAQEADLEEFDIADIDIEDPTFESLLVGRKVKVLLQDVDPVRWRQDLIEDRDRLATLHAAARKVTAERDAKLAELRAMIERKCREPINVGNRKIIVFTAFADTARYLYDALAPWARDSLGVQAALVTGTGGNRTTLPDLRRDLASILTAFAPRTKECPDDLASEGEIDLLIATDCISEGQNLQDCDWLINYDIHWNPVRIIQRFGRIDRIGSPNERIQLVNFWPNMELEEYLRLEQRVSGRMVLLDISATGEENLIEQQSGDPMNDLAYRRKHLLKLLDAVIDLEDLSSGVSIADLTLTDFRIDLADYRRADPEALESVPLGMHAIAIAADDDVPPGVIFCLRAEGTAADARFQPGYPLAPHYLVHVGEDGSVLLPFIQAKAILDRLKRLCVGKDIPDASACRHFDAATRQGKEMHAVQRQLAAAISAIVGKGEERAIASLFSPGGTHALSGEFAGMDDFEVVAFLVVLAGVAS